jgi:glucose 1-dehydrogenase
MKKLENKVALITGSDSGIGRAIALAFAAEGAKVVITYHSDEASAAQVTNQINEQGHTAICFKLDVADEAAVKDLFSKVQARFDNIDILVNNAAVNGSGAPVKEMSTDVFDTCIKTNLYGPFYCSRAFLNQPNLREGNIIFISSIHEDVNTPGNADYNASKAAIKNFSRSLALEVAGQGIRVNNIAPGMILTDMNKEAMENDEVRKEKAAHIPMKKAGTPEDITGVAVFLAAAESAYVTGATFVVDGGLSINIGQGA